MDEFVRDAHNEAFYGGDPDGDDSLTFRASLAPTATAIRLSGNGDGGRVILDLDQTNMPALLWMGAQCPGYELDVTVTRRKKWGHE